MADLEYWATKPTDEVGRHIWERILRYYREMDNDGYFNLIRSSYQHYYGSSTNSADGLFYRSSAVTRDGKQGELYNLYVNVYRNLLQHLIVLTTSERQSLETMAMNTDFESQAQTELGDGLLEYYLTEKRIDRQLDRAVEYAVVLAAGYVDVGWDTMAGKPYGRDPESGVLRYEGDLYTRVRTQMEVIVDKNADDVSSVPWKGVRRQVNKYDLMATYPELADKIATVSAYHAEVDKFSYYTTPEQSSTNSDLIYVFDFYHEKTPAVSDGRMVTLLPGGEVLFDGPLPYKKLQVFPCMPSPLINSPFGYTVGFDLLGIQDMLNKLHSSIATNQGSFGTNNIIATKGHGIKVSQLGGGLNLLEINEGKTLDALQLSKTAPEIFGYVKDLVQIAEQIAGLNSVVRGNPEGALRGASGAAMALLTSQAIQFNTGLQSQFVRLNEDVGTATIHTLQEYAQTPRVALVTGVAKRSYLKQWMGKDIDQLDRVVVKRVSAFSRTTSGKLEIANNLLEAGFIKDPEQYIGVLKTGNLDVMTESPRARALLIRAENERLREGEPVRMLVTDPHAMHIQEHLTVLDDPNTRDNEMITEVVLAHIREHIDALQTTDPALLMMTGQEPLQQSAPGPEAGEMMEPMPEAMDDGMPQMPNQPGMPEGAPEVLTDAYDERTMGLDQQQQGGF